MKKNNFNKYIFKRESLILISIFFSVLVALFIAMVIITNSIAKETIDEKTFNALIIIKEFSLVGLTIFGGSLLSVLLIEKKDKNEQYITNIANDVICDDRFIELLSDKNKENIKAQILGASSASHSDVINSVCDKILALDYYYDECSIDVNCVVDKDISKKTIVKTTKIKSFYDTFVIKNFRLVSSTMKKDNSTGLVIKSISIDNKVLVEGEDYYLKTESIKTDEKVLLRNGYNERCYCELIDDLELNSKCARNIVVEYETIVLNDCYFTNRLSGPCKKYILSFAVSDSKKSSFDICGSAFGFMESGVRTPNIENNHFKIKINSWCFKDDGVSLMYKKQTKNKK